MPSRDLGGHRPQVRQLVVRGVHGGDPSIPVGTGQPAEQGTHLAPDRTLVDVDDPGLVAVATADRAVRAVDELKKARKRGDILIFMPTEQDIRETCDFLEGRNYVDCVILPMFARPSWQEKRRVFLPAVSQKIIVATIVAETAITIPGIR